MVEGAHTAYIRLWGMLVGAVLWNPNQGVATFEFDKGFLEKGLDVSPLKMPVSEARRGDAIYIFPNLSKITFHGLPGMLSDALPDKFGNKIIDTWLAQQGRLPERFSPVERLRYMGNRAMGALEFSPILNAKLEKSTPIDIAALVDLSRDIIAERSRLRENLNTGKTDAVLNIIRVGTSAGGARPKAVIAVNDRTKEVRSGQVVAPKGFTYWILKFDGVADSALGDPKGYGRIEYAYHKMAMAAGITMTECRLLEEGGRAHFMTRRFDRTDDNEKRHLQSLCAIAHFDFNEPGAYAYEQAFQVTRELRLPYKDAEQLFRRMLFNVVGRNQDDHTKNISFLMDKSGKWRLAPAYDVIYAYNPEGKWTGLHQMSVNGKRDNFTKDDLLKVGSEMSIKNAGKILEEVVEAVSRWPVFAKDAGVLPAQIQSVGATHRLFRR